MWKLFLASLKLLLLPVHERVHTIQPLLEIAITKTEILYRFPPAIKTDQDVSPITTAIQNTHGNQITKKAALSKRTRRIFTTAKIHVNLFITDHAKQQNPDQEPTFIAKFPSHYKQR